MQLTDYADVVHDEAIITYEAHYQAEFGISDPEAVAEGETTYTQCQHCRPEFDGAAQFTPKVFRDEDMSDDGYCPRCFNEARKQELSDYDYTADIRPTHLIRWEYRPSEWAKHYPDPFEFYSNEWQLDGKPLETVGIGIMCMHGWEDIGATRVPTPGHSVTAHVPDENIIGGYKNLMRLENQSNYMKTSAQKAQEHLLTNERMQQQAMDEE